MHIVHDEIIYVIFKPLFGFIIFYLRRDMWGGVLEAVKAGQKLVIVDDGGINVLALSMLEII